MKYVRNLLKTKNVDVVHVHFHRDIWIPSMVLRNDRQRKLFLSVYMGVFSKNDLLHRWIYGRVDAIFTSSQSLNALLPERYPVSKETIFLLPYGRRIENYREDQTVRKSMRERLHVRDDELLVGTIVRIDPGKGALDFARSFLYLDQQSRSKIKYLIVGEPTRRGVRKRGESPYEPHCEKYLREIESLIASEGLTEQIILAGYQADVIGCLNAMDIFAFPSHDELYSLVMLDAMAMGLPIIATRAGGNLEQITDGINGSLFEVGNSEDLALRIRNYIDHPDLRKKHGDAARSFVDRRHDMNATIRQLLKFYRTNM